MEAIHELGEQREQVAGVVRARSRLGVVLDGEAGQLRRGEARVETDEPIRWDTDFGAAELSHVNLYDRTVEGLVLKDVKGATAQYHPEAGPGPHDATYLFDRYLEMIG